MERDALIAHGTSFLLQCRVLSTFTPGLSADRGEGDETTLEKYQRKMREKKKKRKEELRDRGTAAEPQEGRKKAEKSKAAPGFDDDFFGADSEEDADEEEAPPKRKDEMMCRPAIASPSLYCRSTSNVSCIRL